MKINVKWFLYLPILFFFLPAFAFYVPMLHGAYLFFYISLYSVLLFIFYKEFYIITYFIKNVIKKTPFKYLILAIILTCIGSFILSLSGITTISQTFRSIIMRIILCILPTLCYFIYILARHLPLTKFMKIFVIALWCYIILGLISYIGALYNIEVINDFFDFFANIRIIKQKFAAVTISATSYKAFGIPRLDNLCEEPALYANFLYLLLPIIYAYTDSKIKLSKLTYFNNLIKYSLVPLTWLSIILTLSPIYLVLASSITLIFYYNRIRYFIKKYYFLIIILITPIFLCILYLILNNNFYSYLSNLLSETYLSRIINVLLNIHSFENFMLIEPSLATRIVSYVNTLMVFIKHPILGVGIGNLENANVMLSQYLNSPLPLTPEIINMSCQTLKGKNTVFINYSYIYLLLSETGIIVTSIVVYFYYKLLKIIKNINILSNNTNYPLFVLSKSVYFSLIALAINAFYNLEFYYITIYLILAIAIVTIYKFRKIQKKGDKQ